MNTNNLNERIAELIESLGISRRKFATKTNLSQPGIQKIVNNLVVPRLETVESILTAFPQVNRQWLLKGEGEMLTQLSEMETKGESWAQLLLTKLEAEIHKKDEEIQWLRNHVSQLASQLGKLKASTFSLNPIKKAA